LLGLWAAPREDRAVSGGDFEERTVTAPPPVPVAGPTLAESKTAEEGAVKRQFKRGSAWALTNYGIAQVIRLGSNLILWRLLVPDAFGLMAIVNSFIIGLSFFSDIGIGQSVVQHERGDDPTFLNTIWTIQVLRGLALSAIACVAAVPVARFYHQPALSTLIPAVALGVALAAFNSTNLFTASRRLSLARLTFIDTAGQVGSLAVMIVWAALTHSVWSLAGGAAVAAVIRLYLSHTMLPGVRNRFAWDKPTLDAVSHFGRWVFVSTLLTFLVSNSDRLVFGRLISMQMLGIYSIAAVWATFPNYIVSHVVSSVLFPLFSRLKGKALLTGFIRMRGVILTGAAWLTACLLAGGPTLIRFLYDRRATDAGPILQLLAIGTWFSSLESANSAAILSLGKPKWLAFGNGAKLAAMLVLMPIGAKLFGFKATVLAFSLAEIARYFVSTGACIRAGLRPLGQDMVLGAGIVVTAFVGLVTRKGFEGLHLRIANAHLDAFAEGASIFLVLTALWGGALLMLRRRELSAI
jgi:O-antigen/teichoic acid export membrane protein